MAYELSNCTHRIDFLSFLRLDRIWIDDFDPPPTQNLLDLLLADVWQRASAKRETYSGILQDSNFI